VCKQNYISIIGDRRCNFFLGEIKIKNIENVDDLDYRIKVILKNTNACKVRGAINGE